LPEIPQPIHKAAASQDDIRSSKPYKLSGPVTFQIEYTSRHALRQGAGSGPGEEVVDARTIRFHGNNFLEAWKRTPF
jgi:D-aminopeptidase